MTAKMRPLETDKDTICALATAPGIGAISVIRISGARAAEITRKLAAFLPKELESHKIYYGILNDAAGLNPVDEVLIAYFQEGRSFTGESTFEISCHGGDILAGEVLRNLIVAGARPAARGEFTYRAYMSGRIDLVQAESVLSLIESRSVRAAQLALRQLQGGFSKRLREILDGMTWVLAHLEANIDFASEDIQIVSPAELAGKANSLLAEIRALVASHREGQIIRHGYHVALVGRPNAGKSSLLNVLAGEERAIVTPIAGTTRDFVEAQLSEAGLQLTLIDTAGLRVTDEAIEKIGVQRTLAKMAQVELVLYIVDAETSQSPLESAFFAAIPWAKTAVVVNKVDLWADFTLPEAILQKALHVLPVSASTGQGLPELWTWLRARLGAEMSEDSTVVSGARQFQSLCVVRDCLEKATPLMADDASPDLIALELQLGIRGMYEVLGLNYDDQVMDRVFAEFCLGK